MVGQRFYYYKREKEKPMTEEDIISANITDLDKLEKIEEYVNPMKISPLFTKCYV